MGAEDELPGAFALEVVPASKRPDGGRGFFECLL